MTLPLRTLLLAGAAVAVIGTAVLAQSAGPDRSEMRMAHAGSHERGDRSTGRHMARAAGDRLTELFEIYDADEDGSLTQAEIDAGRAAQLAEFDANADGSLDLAEYEALWLSAMRERMVDRFQFHDDDGDGQVTVEEFSEMTGKLVSRLDRNGDDMLSPEDARRGRRAE